MKFSNISLFLTLVAGLLFIKASPAGEVAEPMNATAYSLALQHLLSTGRPIESYVSPPTLFPEEGSWQVDLSIKKAPYKSLLAFDRVNGSRIGEVALTKPQCLDGEEHPTGCGEAGQVFLKMLDGREHVVPVQQWSERSGLVSSKSSIMEGKVAWSEIAYAGGTFWVLTDAVDVHSYEELVSYIETVETWCVAPGKCAPASKTLLSAWKDLEGRALNPNGSAYAVDGRVVYKGKAYYRVKLSDFEPGVKNSGLPTEGFVPTRDKSGRHTGTFLPLGC